MVLGIGRTSRPQVASYLVLNESIQGSPIRRQETHFRDLVDDVRFPLGCADDPS